MVQDLAGSVNATMGALELVDFPSIGAFHYPKEDVANLVRPIIEDFTNQGEVFIVDRSKAFKDYDVDTGALVIVPWLVYSGPARIQPLRTDLNSKIVANDTTIRAVQFWIDYPMDGEIPDVRPGFEVVVTDGGNDQYLQFYEYIVTGAMNSSMAWNRTIGTSVNLESRPDYTFGYLYGSVTDDNGDPIPGSSVQVEYSMDGVVWMDMGDPVAPDASSEFQTYVFSTPPLTRAKFSAPGYVDYIEDFTMIDSGAISIYAVLEAI